METKTFKVPAISCQHCVHTIKMEVSELPGVDSVSADKDTQMVTVQWHEPATWDAIRQTLAEINYPPEGLISLS